MEGVEPQLFSLPESTIKIARQRGLPLSINTTPTYHTPPLHGQGKDTFNHALTFKSRFPSLASAFRNPFGGVAEPG